MSIIVVAWLPTAALIWTGRRRLRGRGRVPGVLAAVGVTLLVVTIAWDLGLGWVTAVAILLSAQVIALRAVLSTPNDTSEVSAADAG